jgi:hypothetical protein
MTASSCFEPRFYRTLQEIESHRDDIGTAIIQHARKVSAKFRIAHLAKSLHGRNPNLSHFVIEKWSDRPADRRANPAEARYRFTHHLRILIL